MSDEARPVFEHDSASFNFAGEGLFGDLVLVLGVLSQTSPSLCLVIARLTFEGLLGIVGHLVLLQAAAGEGFAMEKYGQRYINS